MELLLESTHYSHVSVEVTSLRILALISIELAIRLWQQRQKDAKAGETIELFPKPKDIPILQMEQCQVPPVPMLILEPPTDIDTDSCNLTSSDDSDPDDSDAESDVPRLMVTTALGKKARKRVWFWHEERNEWTKPDKVCLEPAQKKRFLCVPKRSSKAGRDAKKADTQRKNEERLNRIKKRHRGELAGVTFEKKGGPRAKRARPGSLEERVKERGMRTRWMDVLEQRVMGLGVVQNDAFEISRQAVFTDLDRKKRETWEEYSKTYYGKVVQSSIYEYDYVTEGVELD